MFTQWVLTSEWINTIHIKHLIRINALVPRFRVFLQGTLEQSKGGFCFYQLFKPGNIARLPWLRNQSILFQYLWGWVCLFVYWFKSCLWILSEGFNKYFLQQENTGEKVEYAEIKRRWKKRCLLNIIFLLNQTSYKILHS